MEECRREARVTQEAAAAGTAGIEGKQVETREKTLERHHRGEADERLPLTSQQQQQLHQGRQGRGGRAVLPASPPPPLCPPRLPCAAPRSRRPAPGDECPGAARGRPAGVVPQVCGGPPATCRRHDECAAAPGHLPDAVPAASALHGGPPRPGLRVGVRRGGGARGDGRGWGGCRGRGRGSGGWQQRQAGQE